MPIGLTVDAAVSLVPMPRRNQRGRVRPSVAEAEAFGTYWVMSFAVLTAFDSTSVVPLTTVTATATSCSFCSRFWAVTTTAPSALSGASAAGGGGAGSGGGGGGGGGAAAGAG